MNRLLALAALSLFLGLDASHAQTSLHKQRVDEQIDETSCASANWLSRTAQLAESTQSDIREAVSIAIEVCGDSARLRVVAKHMTPEQIAEAQRLAREWKPEQ